MKITQQFAWEASHRHLRRDLRHHAYRLTVELDAAPAVRAATQVVTDVLGPLVADWDGAILVAAHDEPLQADVQAEGHKYALLPGETTAEALSRYVADYFCMLAAPRLRSYGVEAVRVCIDRQDDEAATEERGWARASLRADRYGGAKWGSGRAAA